MSGQVSAPVGASNLDRRTHSHQGQGVDPYCEAHVAVFLTDLGVAKEAVVVERAQPIQRPVRFRGPSVLSAGLDRQRSDMAPEDLERSVQRARRNLRYSLMMMRADRIFTFTKRGGFERGELWATWERFVRQVRKVWPQFQAVAVPELHAGGGENDGTYHLHVALNRFYSVQVMRFMWHRALGAPGILRGADSPGNVQASARPAASVVKLARYLAKYLSKGEGEQAVGAKRYSTCGRIPPPERRVVYLPAGGASCLVWRRIVLEFFGSEPKSHHLFNLGGDPGIWFASE